MGFTFTLIGLSLNCSTQILGVSWPRLCTILKPITVAEDNFMLIDSVNQVLSLRAGGRFSPTQDCMRLDRFSKGNLV